VTAAPPTPATLPAQAPRPTITSAAPPARIAAPPARVEPHAAPQAATPSARAPAPTVAPPIVVSSPAERKSRCTEILQKASLEKITAAETDFFRRECK
jgi:hypothetical protein